MNAFGISIASIVIIGSSWLLDSTLLMIRLRFCCNWPKTVITCRFCSELFAHFSSRKILNISLQARHVACILKAISEPSIYFFVRFVINFPSTVERFSPTTRIWQVVECKSNANFIVVMRRRTRKKLSWIIICRGRRKALQTRLMKRNFDSHFLVINFVQTTATKLACFSADTPKHVLESAVDVRFFPVVFSF